MEQYYHPCIISSVKKFANVVAWLHTHKYGSGLKMMEHSYIGNDFIGAFEWLISPEGPHHKSQVVWAGDYAPIEWGKSKNLYDLCDDANHASPSGSGAAYPFIVNHSQCCYINKTTIKGGINGLYKIHPLPLLTAEGTIGSGGDYRGVNQIILGTWARNIISVEKTVPSEFGEVYYEFRDDRFDNWSPTISKGPVHE